MGHLLFVQRMDRNKILTVTPLECLFNFLRLFGEWLYCECAFGVCSVCCRVSRIVGWQCLAIILWRVQLLLSGRCIICSANNNGERTGLRHKDDAVIDCVS